MPVAAARPAPRADARPLDLAVVVPSCDAYADLWPAFFSNLARRWPDRPFPVYLISNTKDHPHHGVVSLRVGEDRGWSANLKNALEAVPHEHVLLIIEDLFPTEQIHTESIASLVDELGQFDYLRLNPYPGPRRAISGRVGVVPPGDIYRTSTVFSIWRRSVLIELLEAHETAWQFELDGSARSDRFERWFASRKWLIPYVNLVIKRKVDPAALSALRTSGLDVETDREVLSLRERWILQMKEIRSGVLRMFPWRLQRWIRGRF